MGIIRAETIWRLRLARVQREMFPTPMARDWKSGKGGKNNRHTPELPEKIGGQLNPTWVEWLMGWPLGWTDLRPLAMDKFQSWLQQQQRYFQEIFEVKGATNGTDRS